MQIIEIFWYALSIIAVYCCTYVSPFRWKHAASCHKESNLAGETDVFIEDEVYEAALRGELDDDEDDAMEDEDD